MGHHSPAPDARLVPLVLLLFFAMSATGHYVFVMQDGHGAASETHGEATEGHSAEEKPAKVQEEKR